jgi:hypothetical protein
MSYSNSYVTITTHAKKIDTGEFKGYYRGFVKVISGATIDGRDVKSSYRIQCLAVRLNRQDAIADAKQEKKDMI